MLSLEAVLVLEAEFLDLSLALRTLLPAYLRTLVTSDMHILGWEKGCNLSEDILKEYHCLFVSGAKHVVSNTPASPYIVRTSGTSVLRICGKSSEHMTRKVNLRNDLDSLCSSVIDDFLYLLLREPASFSISYSVVHTLASVKVAYKSLLSDRSDFSEKRILLDLHSPSLVVGKMPVKGVELVDFHHIEIFLHHIHIEEMS